MNKNKIVAFMSSCILISSSVNSYALTSNLNQNNLKEKAIKVNDSEDLDEIQIKDFGCSEAINKLLSNIEYNLNEYNSSKNLLHLEKSMELFGEIAVVSTKDDLEYFEGETVVYSFFDNIRASIYGISDRNVSGEYLVNFAREILFGWRKNKISEIFPENYLVMGLVEYNEDKIESVQPILNYLRTSYHYMINNMEENTDSEDLPEIEEEPDYTIKPLPPGYGNEGDSSTDNSEDESQDDTNNDDSNTELSDNNFTIDTYYKNKGGSCVLVERKYKDGYLFEQKEKSVSKEDYVYCGIYDYIFDGVESTINNNSGVIFDKDYILNNQNEDSDRFIFYTITKNEVLPYYYNSGIRASSNSSVSYNQLKDALYQVAIQIRGFSTDSNDKSLFIVDGAPVVLTNEKDIYSKEEVEGLLDSFERVGLKVEKELTTSSNGLKDAINNGDVIIIKYKDKEFTLSNLNIKDTIVLAPIQEIVGYFGYKTEIIKNQLIVTKEDYKLKLTLNKKEYDLNGKVGEFKTIVTKKGNEWYGEIGKIMELIGYDIKWDSEGLYFEVLEISNTNEQLE